MSEHIPAGPWTVGVTKHGQAPKPSPDATCWLTVERERMWSTGEPERETFVNEWRGYTAEEARAHRIKRFREARAEIRLEGQAIVHVVSREPWFVDSDRLTFTDEEPKGVKAA